ncbi:PQQ-binding-like beta-propeller repeat protein [Tahibacter sp. UC22_41]|uniref:outer membrane protein assembly factor BamB family protein n=1 Tax=Tahibacter sp. UC22_41 TaxID=3350178 RepID=UPI0036DE7179
MVLLPLALAYAAGVGAGWQQDWTETGPAFGLTANYPLEVASAADGSALIGFSEASDYRLSRVDGNARMVWHVALSPGEWSPSVIYAEPDGAALVMFTGPSYAAVARFDAAGTLQWSSAVQGTRFAVGADRVSAVLVLPDASMIVTAIDRYSGQWLWQRRIPDLTGYLFNAPPPAVDDDGNTYVGGYGDGNRPLLTKLDRQGGVLWQAMVAATATIVARDGRVYAASPYVLQALDAADGQPLWRKDDCGTGESALSFVVSDPVCATGIGVSRLAATSGAEVWHRDVAGDVLGVFGGDVYVGSDPVSFPPADAVLQRLAGGDGAPQWQQSLPFAVRGRIWQGTNGLIGVIGPGSAPYTVALHRYRIQDGGLSDIRPFADVPRGVGGSGEIRGGGDLFVLGQIPWKPLPARVRRLSADSGAVLWENATTQRYAFSSITLTPNRLLLGEQTYEGEALVRSLDRVSGRQRWERSIADPPVYSLATKPPRVVGLGDDDALVSFGYGRSSPSPSLRVQELQRLDDAAGQVLWKQQVAQWADPSLSGPWTEPVLLGVGDDALLWPAGSSTGPIGMGLQRRFGSDGTLDFAATAAPYSQTVRLSVASDAVFALTYPDQNTLRLLKHSASSGELLWQFDYPMTPWRNFLTVDLLPLADGDVVVAVLLYQPTAAAGQSTHLLRVKGDGSGLRYAYRTPWQRKVRDSIDRIVLDTDGNAWLRRSLYRDQRGIYFLQRFDLSQGRVIGSQALALRGVEPFVSRTAWGNTFEPHGEGLLISGTALQSPLPSTRRDALLDIAVKQRGDLALQLPVFPPGIAVGDDVPFAVGVGYTGDAAITDATLIVELPWQGSESGLSCDGPGVSRCELQVRHGQITARFDAASGAQLTLRGTVRRLDAPVLEKSVLRAMVHGPIGLLESDASNNFGSVAVDGPIFVDGFDG